MFRQLTIAPHKSRLPAEKPQKGTGPRQISTLAVEAAADLAIPTLLHNLCESRKFFLLLLWLGKQNYLSYTSFIIQYYLVYNVYYGTVHLVSERVFLKYNPKI